MARQDLALIELEYTDSTNNYAMQLINDDKAHAGMTIVARSQGAGRGQRGRVWVDEPGQSLLMSMIVTPKQALGEQFVFSASVAVAIANVLQNFLPSAKVSIKWPNDIITHDKKAGGILIENVLRGSSWTHSVIGLGINVQQATLPEILPYATSLKIAGGRDIDMAVLRERLREHIMAAVMYPAPRTRIMEAYNDLLYRRGALQRFADDNGSWMGEVLHARADGALEVKPENTGATKAFHHGQVKWEWE